MRKPFFRSVLSPAAFGLCASCLLPVTASGEPLRNEGKLLLTNGISTVEGASGGGLAPWATIAGNETKDGIGVSAHVTDDELKDYEYRSAGAALGLFNRLELSYARQNFNTQKIGAALGLGRDYTFRQDVVGAKLRLLGDVVYDNPLVPAIAVGVQYKHNLNGSIVRALGAKSASGVDVYASATKLILADSLLVNTTLRMTKANQIGLLGFGGDKSDAYHLEFEGSLAYQLSRRLVVGGEYRSKPDNLGVAHENAWFDGFVAYAVNRNLTATVAYTDLGSIATIDRQRGALFSLQAAF
ncbi:DUF3034 family protein [Novosphingobium rosa]|uniref:DUF3034 family protein n=1 Tax=Novosphingobium rosa TaxID=76978 RepID=UPI00083127CB|nr:DUF3034 family protein [Novosphingobium rosa]